jgi:hypothetical protein
MSENIVKRDSLNLAVDSEHGALRLSVVLLFIATWIITYAIANALISSEGFNLIAIIIAFVTSALIARTSEKALQQRWPSGRNVEIDENGVRVLSKGAIQNDIHASEPFSVLLWRFQTKRRSRVPKGWFVIACALEQDDNYLAVYTFTSPELAETLQQKYRFTTLASEKDATAKDTRQDSLRFAGEQRRLRLAETFRWNHGAEMSLEDFEQFLSRVDGQFSQWMPANR